MSRTYKDKPPKLSFDSYMKDMVKIEGSYKHIYLPTTKTKKRKEVDTENHWMSTPGWWIRLMMNRPQRRQQHLLERAALRAEDLEDFEIPDTKRKPHIYYW